MNVLIAFVLDAFFAQYEIANASDDELPEWEQNVCFLRKFYFLDFFLIQDV